MKKHFIALILSLAVSQAASASDFNLLFKSGTVAAPANLEQFIADPGTIPADLFGGHYFRIIQFNQIPTSEQQALLRASGIRLSSYFPEKAWFAIIDANANLGALRTCGARSVLAVQPGWKLHKLLSGGEAPDYAMYDKTQVNLVVRYYKGLEPDPVVAALMQQGYTVIRRYDFSNWLELRADISSINAIASLPFVAGVEPVAPESVPDDERGRSLHRSNVINSYDPMGRHYTGAGVSAALADDGPVGPHIDYTGRIDQSNTTANTGNHGDMTTGILMGAGNLDPTIKGMGTGTFIYIYDIGGYTHILNSGTMNQTQGVMVTSTSYSQGCNDYSTDTQTGDQILNQNPTLLHVYSAGNNGGGNCQYGAGAGWGNITGGYKQGKNVIACGNLNYLDVLDATSSRGPSEDGRVKPDICSNGADQMSTDGPNAYQVGGGTSAACPGIAGIVTQLHQAYRDLNAGQNAEGALIKACLLNTADDIGNPGPDFKFGWGRVNAYRAVTTMEEYRYQSDLISQGAVNTHAITVPANTKQLRVMIYWCDVEGDPLAAKALVNDLNMVVTDPNLTNWDPWILDHTPNAAALNAAAIRGIDDRNNMEQVTIDDPIAGSYTITIDGFLVPTGPQKYYVVYEFVSEAIAVTYPIGFEGFVPGETETIRFDAFGTVGNFQIEYSADNGVTWNLINGNTPAAQRYYNWTVPNIVTGQALIRVTRNGISGQSTAPFSIIGLPSNIQVDWACPDSIRLTWNAVTGATGYEITQLGAMYMDPVGNSATNSAILYGIDPTLDYWFSVGAVTPDNTNGRRANAIHKGPGVFSCPIAIDASVSALVSPVGVLQNCQDLTTTQITIDLENKGLASISNIPVFYSVNNGSPVSETVATTLASFASTTYTFNATFDFSSPAVYDLKVWSDYTADGNHYNDTIAQTVETIQGTIITLPYTEDFESFVNCSVATDCELTQCGLSNGWINLQNMEADDIDWRTNEGPTASDPTGPDIDHNPGNATGNYLYLEATNCFLKEAQVVTPCIDLTTATAPEFRFWYHMYGVAMGTLHVDVYANDVWQDDVIPAIMGNQGNIWLQQTVNLAPFVGGIVNVRFRGVTGPDYTSDMAIDDINITEVNVPPVTNFIADMTNVCINQIITFNDLSQNSPNSWQWNITPNTGFSFANGTSATSQNPQVMFTAAGVYDVELISANGFGSSSLSIPAYINVGSGSAVPLVETFQSGVFPPQDWLIENPDLGITWVSQFVANGANGAPTDAAYVNNFDYNSAGQEDGLVTERVDLTFAINPIVTFDVAYARYSANFEDALRVDISTDCGATFVPTGYLKQGLALATVPDNTNVFTPTAANQWRNDTIDLSAFVGNAAILKFVNITGYGNSLFIDNINFGISNVGLNDHGDFASSVTAFPNPGNGLFQYVIQSETAKKATLLVTDTRGALVMKDEIRLKIGSNSGYIRLNSNPKGVYFLEVRTKDGNRTIKLVVM